ncbi:hypothetical protein CH330_02850 [candidate division WOR-3 bacterium JGI_Cruoil_03_51_56]|uniref:Uncharacterized protein n=1 Tax=candidate division WOR-3 bacterium JGI_Cruoil_03_51_56 TaxID=1973747 RepID=A0A235BVM5_UNCW3|nr:MAG: hypothetical protein CH330_02850 [candidate division WOR-3 bacterium JGI_Cruoil_03_51_56]
MKFFLRIGIVVFLCAVALGYLYMHNRSLRLTKRVSRLETTHRFMTEELYKIQSDVDTLADFTRLYSFWKADTKSGFSPKTRAARIAHFEQDSLPMLLAHENWSPLNNGGTR